MSSPSTGSTPSAPSSGRSSLCGAPQFLLLKRARRGHVRWSLIGGLLAAMLACEIACQIVTGWDLFLPLLLYCFFLFGLLGAALSALLSIFLKKQVETYAAS